MSDIIDLTIFVVEALGYNKQIRQDIDELYQTDKYMFYNAAKNSEFYNHQIITEVGIERQIYSRRVLGILLCSFDDEILSEKIIRIIRKGWFIIYSLVTKSTTHLSYDSFVDVIKENNNLQEISDDKINSDMTIFLILAKRYNIIIDDVEQILHIMKMRLEHYNKESEIRLTHEKINKHLDVVKTLQERIEYNKGTLNTIYEITHPKDNELQNFIDNISFLFDLEEMSSVSIFDEVAVTEDDVNSVLFLYHVIYKNQNVDNASRFLLNNLYLKLMIKAYKKVRDYYFENNQETLFLEMESKDKRIEKLERQNNELRKINEVLKNECELYKGRSRSVEKVLWKNFNKEKNDLHSEINKLKIKLNQYDKDKEELQQLRELLFEIKNDCRDISVDVNIEDKFQELINTKRVLIIGGHENWRNKMTKKFPDLMVVDGVNANIDIGRLIENVDLVFFFWQYMSHSVYNKFIDVIKNKGVRFEYLRSINIELVMDEILEKV